VGFHPSFRHLSPIDFLGVTPFGGEGLGPSTSGRARGEGGNILASSLAALALLKTSWDYNHKDFLDSLLPHFATAISRQSITSEVTADRMARAFRTEWGWNIPVYVMDALVSRALSLGLIRRTEWGDNLPNRDALAQHDYSSSAAIAEEQVKMLAAAYAEYRRSRGGGEAAASAPERELVAYFAQYDIDIISGSRPEGLVEAGAAKGSGLYLVGEFLLWCHENRKDLFETARQLALAQVFASTLTLQDLESYTGSIEGLHVYLDTRIVLQTLGVYGPERKTWVREFLAYLRTQGATLRVFDHTYAETEAILDNCKVFVESGNYNPSFASHACRYFREAGASESDVEEFTLRMRPELEALGVEYFEGSYDDQENEFQPEEQAVREAIEAVYYERDGSRPHYVNEETLRRDVRSITLVHRMRHGGRPHRLTDAQHVFVTTNSGLARASSKLEIEQSGGGVVVPDAVRDVFLATLAWLQAPSGFDVMDSARFLADCHAAIGVDDALVARFLGKVDQLRDRGDIGDEAYYELRMHRYALRVLGDVTLGDLDNVTDATPLEVLARIEDRIKREAEEKYRPDIEASSAAIAALTADNQASLQREAEAKEREAEAKRRVDELTDQVGEAKDDQDRLVEAIASFVASALAWPLLGFLIILTAVAFFADLFPGHPVLQAIQRVCAFILAVLGILSLANGFNVAGVRGWLKRKVAARLSRSMAKG
jgi:hypothetical protein